MKRAGRKRTGTGTDRSTRRGPIKWNIQRLETRRRRRPERLGALETLPKVPEPRQRPTRATRTEHRTIPRSVLLLSPRRDSRSPSTLPASKLLPTSTGTRARDAQIVRTPPRQRVTAAAAMKRSGFLVATGPRSAPVITRAVSLQQLVCKRRVVRRQVLHAKGRLNSGAGGRARWTADSYVRC